MISRQVLVGSIPALVQKVFMLAKIEGDQRVFVRSVQLF